MILILQGAPSCLGELGPMDAFMVTINTLFFIHLNTLMQTNHVDVHLSDGSPIGMGELEIHHSDSTLTFRDDFWISNGVHSIGSVLFTRYVNDNQAMYVRTQEVGRVLQQSTSKTK